MWLRINSAFANQIVIITAGVTGWFEDTTNTDLVKEDDLCCLSLVDGGTGGNMIIGAYNVTEQDMPDFPPGKGNPMGIEFGPAIMIGY
jgi:hypothetical protein